MLLDDFLPCLLLASIFNSPFRIGLIYIFLRFLIIQPVQRFYCSGQFLDHGEGSKFWDLMNEYGVDIYFAGEGK